MVCVRTSRAFLLHLVKDCAVKIDLIDESQQRDTLFAQGGKW
jgi:hypothetical protein